MISLSKAKKRKNNRLREDIEYMWENTINNNALFSSDTGMF